MGNENNYDENVKGLIVQGHRLSSVGPGKVTGDKVVYEPTSLDLAMKSHYLRLVYFLDAPTVLGLGFNVPMLKEALFSMLNYYYEVCGRFRNSETAPAGGDSGGGGTQRPYLKCNDCGVRFVEARSPHSLHDWVHNLGYAAPFHHRCLVYHHQLGPDLMFSPPVFIQMTIFSCGGVSLGISWAHVLGDAFSLSQFMYQLSQFLEGTHPTYPPTCPKSPPNPLPTALHSFPDPLSLKPVGPLGDNWSIHPPCNMETFSFQTTHSQLDHLLKLVSSPTQQSALHFDALCAFLWHAIAQVEPLDTVTIIRHEPKAPKLEDMVLGNNQVVSSVKAHFSVADAHLKDTVGLIHDKAQDERAGIAAMVDRHQGGSDFIVYGAHLTFVDLSKAGFYEFEVKGFRPKLVNCFVDGIGEEGVVLVLPPPKNEKMGGEGKVVTMILPKNYMEATKQELNKVGLLIV